MLLSRPVRGKFVISLNLNHVLSLDGSDLSDLAQTSAGTAESAY